MPPVGIETPKPGTVLGYTQVYVQKHAVLFGNAKDQDTY